MRIYTFVSYPEDDFDNERVYEFIDVGLPAVFWPSEKLVMRALREEVLREQEEATDANPDIVPETVWSYMTIVPEVEIEGVRWRWSHDDLQTHYVVWAMDLAD